MNRRVIALIAAIALHCTSVQAQNGSTAGAFDLRAFRAGALVDQPILLTAFGNQMPIFRTAEGGDSLFYFIPPVFIDLQLLNAKVNEACGSPFTQAPRVQLPISFHSGSMIDEMKDHLIRRIGDKSKAFSIGPPPAAGVLLFAFDEKGAPLKILSTIGEQALLTGYPMTSLSGGMTNVDIATFAAPCEQLRSIVREARFESYLIAPSVSVKVNSLSAIASIVGNHEFKEALDNTESGANKQKVTGRKKGGGISVKFLGINLGGQAGKTTTETETIKYRIINRNWISDRIQSTKSALKLDQLCETETCGDEKIVDLILARIFEGFHEEEISFSKRGDAWYAATQSKGEIPVGKLKLDDELKSDLDNSLKVKAEAEVQSKGLKVKKSDDFDTTDHSGITWKKSGEDWFPVSIKAHVYDMSEINKRMETAYNQTILGTTHLVATRMMVIHPPREPEATRKLELTRIAYLRKALEDAAQRRRFVPSVPPPLPVPFGPNDRRVNTQYFNNYSFSILVEVEAKPRDESRDTYCYLAMRIDGARVASSENYLANNGASISNSPCMVQALVPPQSSYRVESAGNTVADWQETQLDH